jgi:hypothetical protein
LAPHSGAGGCADAHAQGVHGAHGAERHVVIQAYDSLPLARWSGRFQDRARAGDAADHKGGGGAPPPLATGSKEALCGTLNGLCQAYIVKFPPARAGLGFASAGLTLVLRAFEPFRPVLQTHLLHSTLAAPLCASTPRAAESSLIIARRVVIIARRQDVNIKRDSG